MMHQFAKSNQFLLGLMLCFVAAVAVGATPSSSTSHYERPIGGKGPFKDRVIVFVHGLFGNASDTWTSSEGVYWPRLLLGDSAFDESDVYVASYESPYFGNTMTVDELVVSLNDRFASDGVFEKHREVVFVCHSLGGIVIQQFLVTYQKQYADKVPFIYFFAVPEEGSQVAALGQLLSKDPLLEALLHGNENDYLLALETQWRAAQFSTRRYCAYEKKPLKGSIFIVDRRSGTRNCDVPARPINEDHWGIVKPNNRKHSSYIALLTAVLANPVKPKPSEAPNTGTRSVSPPLTATSHPPIIRSWSVSPMIPLVKSGMSPGIPAENFIKGQPLDPLFETYLTMAEMDRFSPSFDPQTLTPRTVSDDEARSLTADVLRYCLFLWIAQSQNPQPSTSYSQGMGAVTNTETAVSVPEAKAYPRRELDEVLRATKFGVDQFQYWFWEKDDKFKFDVPVGTQINVDADGITFSRKGTYKLQFTIRYLWKNVGAAGLPVGFKLREAVQKPDDLEGFVFAVNGQFEWYGNYADATPYLEWASGLFAALDKRLKQPSPV